MDQWPHRPDCTTHGSRQPSVLQFSLATPRATAPDVRSVHGTSTPRVHGLAGAGGGGHRRHKHATRTCSRSGCAIPSCSISGRRRFGFCHHGTRTQHVSLGSRVVGVVAPLARYLQAVPGALLPPGGGQPHWCEVSCGICRSRGNSRAVTAGRAPSPPWLAFAETPAGAAARPVRPCSTWLPRTPPVRSSPCPPPAGSREPNCNQPDTPSRYARECGDQRRRPWRHRQWWGDAAHLAARGWRGRRGQGGFRRSRGDELCRCGCGYLPVRAGPQHVSLLLSGWRGGHGDGGGHA